MKLERELKEMKEKPTISMTTMLLVEQCRQKKNDKNKKV